MDGIIIVNKHKGCTSHDIVYKVKKICNEKVGHTGTLDPMATGVLTLLIGKGTLCSKYLINHDKIYIATIQLGIETDTLDADGNVIDTKEVSSEILNEEHIKKILNTFLGKQEQVPPIYSAIKVNGKKLYQYAREGKSIEVQPRNIEIYNIKLLEVNQENKQIKYEIHCSKGTYIRSLCNDISKKLGTIGHMLELQRIQVGEFNILNSVTLEQIQNNPNELEKHLITIEDIFKDKEIINLDNKKLQLFLNGVQLNFNKEEGVYKIYNANKFIGIGCVKDNKLKRDIVLCQ
ncbi:MAG: tRNA pseudouridine(55) synthase TruB [Clostridia bacterium]|nr:tRNA pseudouridine(55) synthase TruB [Clostridia bacterium]